MVLLQISDPNYFQELYLPVFAWLLLVVLILGAMLFKFPLNSKWEAKGKENPHAGETLGIPRGFIRGILTFTLLFVAVLFELFNIKHQLGESYIAEFITAFQMMIAFYFGSKVMHHVTSVDKHKADTRTQHLSVKKAEDTKEYNEYGEGDDDFNDPEAAG